MFIKKLQQWKCLIFQARFFKFRGVLKGMGMRKKVKIQLSSSKISLLAQKTVTWGRGEYHNTISLVVKKEIKYMYVITFSVQHKEKIHIYTSAHKEFLGRIVIIKYTTILWLEK